MMRKIHMMNKYLTRIPFGAWYKEEGLPVFFPENWRVHIVEPKDSTEIDNDNVAQAFSNPIGSARICELARGKLTAAIALDDITRPTPVHQFLSALIEELVRGGIREENICIFIATGAHRPMSLEEVGKRITFEFVDRFKIAMHEFMGPDLRRIGWIEGGPVYLNRHFVQADLKICVGCVMPHNETGFSGGSKVVVPGLSGHFTIAHLHGALPPRPAGQIEANDSSFDRRSWSEAVARYIGVDAIVCAVVNSKRQLAGLYVGDLIKAHRTAAIFAKEVGRTAIQSNLARTTDIVVVNCYPLDTDPVQMAKSVTVANKLSPRCIVAINAASDGIFYHGMGMGCGINSKRLVRNLLRSLWSPYFMLTWLRSMLYAIRNPILFGRLSYFMLNSLSYPSYQISEGLLPLNTNIRMKDEKSAKLFVFSPNMPDWGFVRRYPQGRLYRDWQELIEALSQRFQSSTNVLLLPCAPLQILTIQ
jgi:nickel-dependent lactate racemase